MRCLISFVLLFLITTLGAQNEQEKLEKLLLNFPDISFTKISKQNDRYLQYTLAIRQPLDHQNPKRGYFSQSVILTHVGFDRPTVMETQGYSLNFADNEIKQILRANNLNIEHRFLGIQYLTLYGGNIFLTCNPRQIYIISTNFLKPFTKIIG